MPWPWTSSLTLGAHLCLGTLLLGERPLQIAGAAGVTVTNTFDVMGRLLTRKYADGGVESFVYGANGNGRGRLIQHTDPISAVTRLGYDAAGRRNAVTNALLEMTRFAYNAAGDLTELVDGKNQTNRWHYDLFGRVVSQWNANGQTNFAFAYDANDRQTNRWTPAKGNKAYTYDPVGNLRTIHYPASSNVTFTYDALNRVRQMTDAAGTTVFAHTKTSQLASEDGPWSNDLLTNSYSQQLRVSSTLGNTWTNTYGYDDARRLNSVTSGAGSFPYEFAGASDLRRRVGLLGNRFITNRYDLMGRLTNTTLYLQSWQPFWTHGYGHDLAGRRSFATSIEGLRADYVYDAIGQLRSARGIIYPSTNFGYAYDAAGNVTFRTNDAQAHALQTDALNQLTGLLPAGALTVSGHTTTNATNVTVNGVTATLTGSNFTAQVPLGDGAGTVTAIGEELFGRRATNVLTIGAALLYDANENLLFDGQRGYGYDDENRLALLLVTNQWRTEWTYDGLGRRRIRREATWTGSSWGQTNETRYVFDGLLILQERDSLNAVRVTYTRGLDLSGSMDGAGGIGGLLARTDTVGSADYFADGNGDVSDMEDTVSERTASYFYDPFGRPISSFGSLDAPNEMQFSSMPVYRGVVLYHARAYAPHLHRWTSADPIGFAGGLNLHAFVENDPVNWIDDWGMQRVPTGLGGSQYSINRDIARGLQGNARGFGGRYINRNNSWEDYEQWREQQGYERAMRQRGLDPNMSYLNPPPRDPLTTMQNYRPALPPCSRGQTFNAATRAHSELVNDFKTNPNNWERTAAQTGTTPSGRYKGGLNSEAQWRNKLTGEELSTHEAWRLDGASIKQGKNVSPNLPDGGSIRPRGDAKELR